jgi:hypothetical protein
MRFKFLLQRIFIQLLFTNLRLTLRAQQLIVSLIARNHRYKHSSRERLLLVLVKRLHRLLFINFYFLDF